MQPSLSDMQAQFGLSDGDLQALKSALVEGESNVVGAAITRRAPPTRGMLHQIELKLGSAF